MSGYTEAMADRDARLIELADARAQLARILVLGPSMHTSEAWQRLRAEAEARLRSARRACADCWEIADLVGDQVRSVEMEGARS